MRVTFIVPRFHTNMVSWVTALKDGGHEVRVLAVTSYSNEDHCGCPFELIRPSAVTRIFDKRINPQLDAAKRARYFVPDITWLWAQVAKGNPDIVIYRPNVGPLALIFVIMALVLGLRILLYTQGAKYRPYIKVSHRLFAFIVFRVLHWRWFTPVKCRGVYDAALKDVSPNLEFLPFAHGCESSANPRSYRSRELKFMTVGKMEPVKNLVGLVDVMGELSKQYAFTLDMVALCTSNIHRAYLDEVQRQISNADIEDRVQILLNRPHSEVLGLYRNADVFILPSTGDLASVSQLEAMAYGIPAILSDANGTTSYVEQMVTGIVYRNGDRDSFRSAIEYFLKNPEQAACMGMKAADTVRVAHNGQELAQRLLFGFAAVTKPTASY